MTAARGFVVEFVGIPGAGKSTLSHAVAEELRRRGQHVTEPTRDLTHRSGTQRRILSKLVEITACVGTRVRPPGLDWDASPRRQATIETKLVIWLTEEREGIT